MEPSKMAQLLAKIVDGSFDDVEEEYSNLIDAESSVSNTFVVTDRNTDIRYLCTVKKVSK